MVNIVLFISIPDISGNVIWLGISKIVGLLLVICIVKGFTNGVCPPKYSVFISGSMKTSISLVLFKLITLVVLLVIRSTADILNTEILNMYKSGFNPLGRELTR